MNRVTMFMASESIRKDVLMASITENTKELIEFWECDPSGNYKKSGSFFTDEFGADACEEAFDLSNNPARQSERLLVQGKTKSLSVGDVCRVDLNGKYSLEETKFYMCANIGWVQLDEI